MINHDRLFKELLVAFFYEFIELFLPQLAGRLDKESLVFLDKEVFTDVASGERHEVDVLARGKVREEDVFFLIHTETQAQDPAPMPGRMFDYFARLHRKYRLPVYPIVVLSHDSARPEPEQYEVSFADLHIVRFNYRVIHLRRLTWRDFVRQANPVAAALMAKMGMREEERPRVKLECLRLLTTLQLNPAKMRLISGFIDTYLQLNTQETLQFNQEADTLLNTNEKARVMELTTTWKEEGRQEGRQEGREEGRREGQVDLVLRMLRRRLGSLSEANESAIQRLTIEQLEHLGEALLDFHTEADLRQWLPQ